MFKKISLIIVLFIQLFKFSFLCQSAFAEEEKIIFILPENAREEPKYTLEKLKKEVGYLNKYIGSYPPTVTSKEDKQKVYNRWSEALVDANAHLKKEGKSEEILSILSELLRIGHNLDVQGTGYLAQETINLCLTTYTDSLNCNFSAMRFYLSIEPTRENLSKVKKSIDFLTFVYSDDLPPEVLDATAYLNSYLAKKNTAVKKEPKTPQKVVKSKQKVVKAKAVKLATKKKTIISKKTKSKK